jgi:hypothetical protein
MRWVVVLAALALIVNPVAAREPFFARASDEAYLTWPAKHAEAIGEGAYKRGRVGSFWGDRGPLQTERAQNYKLAATLFTPAVIRAAARVLQLRSRLSPERTRELVAEAERVRGLVVMIELDPREGSGVIPLDWEAFLQPTDEPNNAVRGVNTPALRDAKAFGGVLRRNYDYDRFWVVFPDGANVPYKQPAVRSVQLVVRVHNSEGRVDWPAMSSTSTIPR